MTQIQLLSDETFRDRVTLQSIVLARANANVADQTLKDYFRQVLSNPNDGQRVNNYITLIVSQIDMAAYDALVLAGNETNINNFMKNEIVKVYKEAAKIWI